MQQVGVTPRFATLVLLRSHRMAGLVMVDEVGVGVAGSALIILASLHDPTHVVWRILSGERKLRR